DAPCGRPVRPRSRGQPGPCELRRLPARPQPRGLPGDRGMSETQVLLSKIVALRQRLEQAQGLIRDAGSTAASLLGGAADPVRVLERKVTAGARQHALLDSGLRQLAPSPAGEGASLPAELTARAARLLRRGGELLGQLRALGEEPLLQRDDGDPVAVLYRETVAMTDPPLRTVQPFPEAPPPHIPLPHP